MSRKNICDVCQAGMEEGGEATQVYRRGGATVTVSGIPAVRTCPRCQNAVLEWEIAEQVEDLIGPLFTWMESHSMPRPVITVVFPSQGAAA